MDAPPHISRSLGRTSTLWVGTFPPKDDQEKSSRTPHPQATPADPADHSGLRPESYAEDSWKPPPSRWPEMMFRQPGECLPLSSPWELGWCRLGISPWKRSVRILAHKLHLLLVENVSWGKRKGRRAAQYPWCGHFLSLLLDR